MRQHDCEWMPFEEARAFVHRLNLRRISDWLFYCEHGKKPANIPKNPGRIYKNQGWADFPDWLGTPVKTAKKTNFLPFEEARDFIRSLQLKEPYDWINYKRHGKKPANIPANPDKIYKDLGWAGIYDWLGIPKINNRKKDFLPFDEARAFVHSLHLKTTSEWINYKRSGKNL